jgi:hypothetical protein
MWKGAASAVWQSSSSSGHRLKMESGHVCGELVCIHSSEQEPKCEGRQRKEERNKNRYMKLADMYGSSYLPQAE